MKKLLPFSLKISNWTLVLWLIFYQLDAFRWVLFCYGLMLIHECFHAFAALMNGCTVVRIVMYPFGLCAQIDGVEQLPHLRKFIVYLAGPSAHLVMQLLILFLFAQQEISLVMKQYLTQINLNYFLFNLLPMYPLDGYHLLETVFTAVFHKPIFILMQAISFFVLFVFVLCSPARNIAFFLCSILLFGVNVIRSFQFKKEMLEKQIIKHLKTHHVS